MTGEPDQRLADLPSLDRWGDELRDATQREERRSARFRLPIRRVAVAVAVMLLAVPGAIATRSIWVDPIDRVDPERDPASTPAVLLMEGRGKGVQWRLGAFDRSNGARCVQLQTVGHEVQPIGGCTRTVGGPGALTVGAGESPGVGFVFGTVTARAAKLRITLPGGRTTVVEALEPDAESLRRAGLTDRRVYVGSFRGGYDPATGVPLVVVLDEQGREIARAPEGEGRP